MGYIPLFMAVTDQPCVVVGGDAVAEERVRLLLTAGAKVTVISPSLTRWLKEMAERGAVQYRARALKSGDLAGFALVYCVEADLAIARRAAAEARSLGVPINVMDRPALGSFIAPAVVRRGALQIAVSTSGSSPALAKIIRQELEASFGAQYELLLAVLAGARRHLRQHERDPARRAELSHALARALRDPLMRDDYTAAEAELRRYLGLGLADLGIDPPPQSSAKPIPVTPGSV